MTSPADRRCVHRRRAVPGWPVPPAGLAGAPVERGATVGGRAAPPARRRRRAAVRARPSCWRHAAAVRRSAPGRRRPAPRRRDLPRPDRAGWPSWSRRAGSTVRLEHQVWSVTRRRRPAAPSPPSTDATRAGRPRSSLRAGRAGARGRRLRPAGAVSRLGPARRPHRRAAPRPCSRAAGWRSGRGCWSPAPARSCCRSPPRWPPAAPRCVGVHEAEPARRAGCGTCPRSPAQPAKLRRGGRVRRARWPGTGSRCATDRWWSPRTAATGSRRSPSPGSTAPAGPRRHPAPASRSTCWRSATASRPSPNCRSRPAARCARPPTARSSSSTDGDQRTSNPRVFAAGETTGIGGAQLAVAEGIVAGAAGRPRGPAGVRAPARARLPRPRGPATGCARFAAAMHAVYPVPPAWLDTSNPDTVVCRCEEVTVAEIDAAIELGARDARTVKLLSRAGMGWCQGRECGYATGCLIAAPHRRAAGPGQRRRPPGRHARSRSAVARPARASPDHR